VSSIAESLGVSPGDVATVLRSIQELDPVGTGARDARECLLIQARSRYPDRPHLARLIEGHLPDLKERHYSVIARALSIAVDAVREEEKVLLTLNPKPARGFGRDAATCIMPDVRIFKVGGDLLVRVNDDGLPRLRVSPQFRRILCNPRGVRSEDIAFARARVAAAKWFLRCIYERQRTILKVTEAIVARQRDFFEYGRQALRPMILRDVAEDIRMCESTVGRVTSGKYADTPQGLVELRSFFGAGFRGTNGTEVASEAAKAMIRRIVGLEDPARPLSDQQILSRLRSEHGVVIARRTVAKYRDGLGIADSSARRR
jgi:RNA polymerase sigma-54 factor